MTENSLAMWVGTKYILWFGKSAFSWAKSQCRAWGHLWGHRLVQTEDRLFWSSLLTHSVQANLLFHVGLRSSFLVHSLLVEQSGGCGLVRLGFIFFLYNQSPVGDRRVMVDHV